MGGAKQRCHRMTSPSQNGTKIEMAKSVAVVRRSPFQRNGRTTRPAKMSRIPLIHMKGKEAGRGVGMAKPAEAPTGLSMKLMPIAMIATGTTSVHQNSSEFLLNIELPKSAFMFVVLFAFSSPSRERGVC